MVFHHWNHWPENAIFEICMPSLQRTTFRWHCNRGLLISRAAPPRGTLEKKWPQCQCCKATSSNRLVDCVSVARPTIVFTWKYVFRISFNAYTLTHSTVEFPPTKLKSKSTLSGACFGCANLRSSRRMSIHPSLYPRTLQVVLLAWVNIKGTHATRTVDLGKEVLVKLFLLNGVCFFNPL